MTISPETECLLGLQSPVEASHALYMLQVVYFRPGHWNAYSLLVLAMSDLRRGKKHSKNNWFVQIRKQRKHKMASGTVIKLGGGIQRSGEAVDDGT